MNTAKLLHQIGLIFIYATVFSLSLITAMMHLLLSSTAIFMLTILLILSSACPSLLLQPCCMTFNLLSPLFCLPLSCKSQHYSLSFISSLINSGTRCLLLCFLLSMIWTLQRELSSKVFILHYPIFIHIYIFFLCIYCISEQALKFLKFNSKYFITLW